MSLRRFPIFAALFTCLRFDLAEATASIVRAARAIGEFALHLVRVSADRVRPLWHSPLAQVAGEPCSDYDGPPVSFTRYEAGQRRLAAARGI